MRGIYPIYLLWRNYVGYIKGVSGKIMGLSISISKVPRFYVIGVSVLFVKNKNEFIRSSVLCLCLLVLLT